MVNRATGPIRAFRRQMGGALKDVEQQADRLHQAMQRATFLGLAGAGVGVASRRLSDALRGPVAEAADFETAMAGVRKVVDFKEPGGLTKLGDKLREMSLVIPLTAAGLAQIAAAGGQFGLPEDKLERFTAMTAKVAVAWDILPDKAGESIAKLSNVFQIPIEDTERLADTINHLGNNVAAEAPQIAEALLRMGGNARLFGLAQEETAALAAAMIALGRPPEVAARAMNTLLSRLQTADAQGKKFQAAMKFIGLESGEFKKAIEQDAGGALQTFLERLETLSNAQRAKALTFLFGEGFSDEIGILVGSLDTYRKNLALLADEQDRAGSVQKEFDAQNETTNNGFVLLKNTLAGLKGEIGEALLPAVRDLMGVLKSVVGWVTEWVREHPGLTKVIVGTVGALAALFAVLSPLLITLAGATVLFAGGGAAIAGIGAAASVATGALAALLPMLAAVAGGLAVGGLIGTAVNNLPKVFGSKERLSDKFLDLFMDDFDPNGEADPELVKRVRRGFARPEGPVVNGGGGTRGEINGRIEVAIDSEGRPRVKSIQSANPDVEMVADVGMVMQGG